MNGLIPALIAVMLIEIGPRAMLYADARHAQASLWIIVVMVFGAAAAGVAVAPMLTDWADAFMIALALAFGAIGQLQRIRPASGVVPVVIAFWRGGVALAVFAFAARFGVFGAAFGAIGGLVAAAVVSRAARGAGIPLDPLRWGAAGVLAIAAFVVAIGALRLT